MSNPYSPDQPPSRPPKGQRPKRRHKSQRQRAPSSPYDQPGVRQQASYASRSGQPMARSAERRQNRFRRLNIGPGLIFGCIGIVALLCLGMVFAMFVMYEIYSTRLRDEDTKEDNPDNYQSLEATLPVEPVYAHEGPQFIEVEHDNVHFVYNATLATGVEATEEAENEYSEGAMASWPAHTRFLFVDYTIEAQQPAEILFYPAKSLTEHGGWEVHWLGRVGALPVLLDDPLAIADLANRMSTNFDQKPLPFLSPGIGAHQEFWAKLEYVEFESGAGIRYVTRYIQDAFPLTADGGLLYTFQGITEDGEYYIFAQFPMRTSIFPNEIDSETFDFVDFRENYAAYRADVIESLFELPDDEFTPSLEKLDALIVSINTSEAK